MLQVADIYDDAKAALGTCEQAFVFRRITQAVEALANTGQWDPLTGYADICVDDCYVTLPREIETPLAINVNGHPTLGRDALFEFHLNGPGANWGSCRWEWMDQGDVVTYRELTAPSRLVAFTQRREDDNAELWVYGYDEHGQVVRSQNAAGEWVDGCQIPVLNIYALPNPNAVYFSRITRIRKAATIGQIRLCSFDNSVSTGVLVGVYEHDELDPIYRRIRVSTSCATVRMSYRRRTTAVRSLSDRIPLHSSYAVVLMLRALKAYDDGDLSKALGFEANAVRFLNNEEFTRTPPGTVHPVQMDNRSWSAWDDGIE